MNNDTHTEERRQWVRNQQEDTLEEFFGNDTEGLRLAEQYHQYEFDKDHEAALRANALFDTLQSILDYSPNKSKQIIRSLKKNWIVKTCMRQ